MKKIFIGFFFIAAAITLTAQSFEQTTKLFALDRAPGNQFGHSVAISGNYAVIAAADVSGGQIQNSCECVYVFEKTNGTWSQKQKLFASDKISGSDFGHSVSISGKYIIVGAPAVENGAGAAYIFERNASGNWVEVKKIVAPDKTAGDLFGTSVSITSVYGQGDGSYAVVGAPGDADYGTMPKLAGAGTAYFFTNLNGTWEVLNKAGPDINDRSAGAGFGTSVAMSGKVAVIGAPWEKKDTTGANPIDAAGAAYVFERNGNGGMQLLHKITDWSRAPMDYFGSSVAINGNTILVGSPWEDEDLRMENPIMNAGSVHVFERKDDNRWWWTQKLIANDRKEGDNFGHAVSVSGNMAIVSSVAADEPVNSLSATGAAYIFLYDGDKQGWTTKQIKIVATDRAANDWFGYSVAIDADNILIGAPLQDRNNTRLMAEDAGAIYVFGKTACTATTSSISPSICKTYTSPSKKHTWTRSGTYTDTLLNKAGCDSIITINLTITNIADTLVTKKGRVLTANAKDAGYQWIDCATNQPINVTTRSLIVTVNGSYKVIVDQNGCVGTSSCHYVTVIATPDSTPVVTTPPVLLPKNVSVQKAFIEVNKIVAQDRTHNDEFGRSVSISGNYAIVGVPIEREDAKGTNPINGAGAAYIYKLDDGGKWKQLQKIVAGDRGAGDNFGCSVGISGGYIVVGARYDHKNASGVKDNNLAGSAYIFELNQNGTWYLIQKITADAVSRGGQEYFGTAVAIEGRTIVVSAPDHAKDATNSLASNVTAAGALYVFDRSGAGWIQTQKIVAVDRELGSWLGNSVAICGNNIIAGAWGGDHDANRGNRMEAAGAAYIFERSGGAWKQTQKLVANDRSPHDEFGFSVAISGDYAVVGARRVTEKKEDEDNGQYTGSAYVFKRKSGGGWSQQMKINPDDRTKEDYLGTAVGISGNYLIVSAPGQDTDSLGNYMANAGAIYVYYLDKKGNWILSDKISTFLKHQLDGFGFAAAISDCNIIGTSYINQTDEEDKNAITNAGSANIFTAAGCNNDGRCSGRLFPWDKTPIDKTQSAINNSTNNDPDKWPKKIESTDLKGDGNEISINTINLGNDGLTQPININSPKPKTESVETSNDYNPKTIHLCIDKINNDTLPPRPPDEVYRFVPKINADGTVEEIPGVIKQQLSILTDKMWNMGQELTVGFYPNQTTNFVTNKVKQYAVVWQAIANIRFRFVPDTTGATIRVGFDTADGSWSHIGRNALLVDKSKKTMNFGWFNNNTDEDEFRKTILHEFGHALGFIHEHQAPTGGIQWDKEKVYSYFGSSPNEWSRKTVDEQVFSKYNITETNSSIYDSRSIMHYYFPPELTKNSFSFSKNTQLSKTDTDFVKMVYPLPFEPGDARGMLLTGGLDCDEIVFIVDYNASGVGSNEIDFILEPGIDHHGNWITEWKKIGIPLRGGGEATLEIQNKSVSNRKIAVSLIDKEKPMTFWKAKLLGIHTLLDKKWYVMPALVGGCRVRLTWRKDSCL
jgi:FG-GAP repeat/Astacin (Peptidase family M12A)